MIYMNTEFKVRKYKNFKDRYGGNYYRLNKINKNITNMHITAEIIKNINSRYIMPKNIQYDLSDRLFRSILWDMIIEAHRMKSPGIIRID